MKKTIFLGILMAFAAMAMVSAHGDNHDHNHGRNHHGGQGAVYGILPQQGLFYARYPVYHSTHIGNSFSHGVSPYNRHRQENWGNRGNWYHPGRTYLSSPYSYWGKGFYATPYSYRTYHRHSPLLYPGIYRFQSIW